MRHAQEQGDGGIATNTTNGLHEPNHAEIQWQINNANKINTGNPIVLTTNTTNPFNISSSIGTATFNMYSQREVIKVEIRETTIAIAYREKPNFTYAVNYASTPADRIWKEVYGLKDGKMTLLEVIHGKHTPSHNVQETLEFDDEKEKG